jgi:diguanylate cyclase (GGDEF)-like protein
MGRDSGHDSAVAPRSARLRLASDASSVEPPTGEETAALRDVIASSRDLAAGQRDRAAAEEQEAFLLTEDLRDSIIRALVAASGVSRDHAAADRAAAASDRHLAAEDRASAGADGCQAQIERQRLRDVNADARDVAADARDRASEAQEQELRASEDLRDCRIRALLSAGDAGRDHAAADRAGAASDRHLAAEDRASASADVGQARLELEQAHLDSLTGAQRRDLGRKTLQREIERSRRSGEPFALAFIDVDGLKELNDRQGHAAGDTLLQAVVGALRTALRSYDPIVRLGGDEFLCGFTNTDLETARRRVEEIRAGLADGTPTASVSVGIAMLGERDTLEMLIARADADMYSRKERRRIGA